MPKPTTFIAIDPAGVTHKRTSQNRVYTHTVVYLPNYEYDLSHADREDVGDVRDWEHFRQMVAWGGIYGGDRKPWHTDEKIAQDLAACRERADEYATAAEAIAGERRKRIARVEQMRAAGHYDTFINAGWCGRLDLAQKLAATQSKMKQVTILDVTKV